MRQIFQEEGTDAVLLIDESSAFMNLMPNAFNQTRFQTRPDVNILVLTRVCLSCRNKIRILKLDLEL